MNRPAAVAVLALAVAAPAAGFEYSQTPVLQSMNASTGLNSEIADDIPALYAGQVITEVTLYVGEWLAPWVDPQALVIRLYDGTCAPPLSHLQEFVIDWSTLSPVFYGVIANGGVAYEVTATLPQPVTITAATSMGVSVDNAWGPGAPFCGFLTTLPGQVAGCGELYWDLPGTAPRWTPCSSAVGFSADLAYRISGGATSAPEPQALSWGRVKDRFR